MKLRRSKNKKIIRLANKFQPWDFGFNLEIERTMLEKMLEYFSSKESYAMDSERLAKEIKLAIALLDIIMEKDSAIVWKDHSRWELVKYINIRNANRFEMDHPFLCTDVGKDYIRQAKAWYLYHKLRLYRMKYWWD